MIPKQRKEILQLISYWLLHLQDTVKIFQLMIVDRLVSLFLRPGKQLQAISMIFELAVLEQILK